jgi:hypothetical protein
MMRSITRAACVAGALLIGLNLWQCGAAIAQESEDDPAPAPGPLELPRLQMTRSEAVAARARQTPDAPRPAPKRPRNGQPDREVRRAAYQQNQRYAPQNSRYAPQNQRFAQNPRAFQQAPRAYPQNQPGFQQNQRGPEEIGGGVPANDPRPGRTMAPPQREVVPEEEMAPQTDMAGPVDDFDGNDGYDGNGPHGGGSCGGCQRPSCPRCCGGFCGPPGRVWVRAEYLYWFSEGMRIPALVTTGPSAAQPGFLGSPGTTILFGNTDVNGYARSGGRITAGTWLNACQTIGLEADYFALQTANTNFSATSGGNPILSRPFFDTRPSLEDQNVEQVASPGSVAGTVTVDTYTKFQSGGVRMLFNWCCSQHCYSNACSPCLNGPGGYRLDFSLGYRYMQLSDGVQVNEYLSSLNANLPGSFIVNDNFTTQNQFNGFELGTSMFAYRNRWSLELLTKLALGNNHETVNINGFTTTTQNGVSTTDSGGLLAQSSNIGSYSRDEFCVIPQLGANLGYQLTPRLRAIVGYTFVYWSRVARAGNQIDTDVNSLLLPNNPNPPAGDLRHPQFVFRDTDFWAQGISAGLDYRF